MLDMMASLAGQLAGAVVVVGAGLVVLGLPLAIWDAFFGRHHSGRGKGGVYPSDRSAQEFYERRLRDSRRP